MTSSTQSPTARLTCFRYTVAGVVRTAVSRSLLQVMLDRVLRDRYLAGWSSCILDPCAYGQLAIYPPLIRRAICSRCPVWPRVLIPGLGSYLMCAALLALRLSVVCCLVSFVVVCSLYLVPTIHHWLRGSSILTVFFFTECRFC